MDAGIATVLATPKARPAERPSTTRSLPASTPPRPRDSSRPRAAAFAGRAAQGRGDRRDPAGVRIRGDEPDPGQAAGEQVAEEPEPAGAVFAGGDLDTEDLAVPSASTPVAYVRAHALRPRLWHFLLDGLENGIETVQTEPSQPEPRTISPIHHPAGCGPTVPKCRQPVRPVRGSADDHEAHVPRPVHPLDHGAFDVAGSTCPADQLDARGWRV
jgi:hypothetical protein